MLRLFFLQASIFILTSVLYLYFGLGEGYVYTIFWFDILLHFLGGLWVALASAWFFRLVGVRLHSWQLLILVFAAGGTWELLEYVFDIGGSNFMSYRMDTIKDLVDDLLGGATAILYVRTSMRDTMK